MKKKILGGIAIIAIAAVTAFNVNFNTQSNDSSLISLANVEALASGESGSIDCCSSCSNGYCGMFYPANGTGVGIKMYYK